MAAYWDKQPSSRIVKNQNLVYVGSSIPSTNFGPNTVQIRVISQIAGVFKIGDPSAGTITAVSSLDMPIPASSVGGEYFQVAPGQACAFVSTSTSSGIVGITEMF